MIGTNDCTNKTGSQLNRSSLMRVKYCRITATGASTWQVKAIQKCSSLWAWYICCFSSISFLLWLFNWILVRYFSLSTLLARENKRSNQTHRRQLDTRAATNRYICQNIVFLYMVCFSFSLSLFTIVPRNNKNDLLWSLILIGIAGCSQSIGNSNVCLRMILKF